MWADVGRDNSSTSPRVRGKAAAPIPEWAQPPKHKIGFFKTTNQSMFHVKLPQSARGPAPSRYVAPKGSQTSRLSKTKDTNFDFYMTTNKSMMKCKAKKKVHFNSPVNGHANRREWGGFRQSVARTPFSMPPPPKVRNADHPYYSSQKYYFKVKHWKTPRLVEEPANFETSYRKFHAKLDSYDNRKLASRSKTYMTRNKAGYAKQCGVGGPMSAWK
uniref:Uncharacterized protein n=1 Tax=Lotharella oceanica TaxID=641309 RepID=A0A7S2TVI5_9EUKA|mmetsp:Transcript_30162/g.56347  ORF Transcript_30162/g.56347 Transcript_30162/m.56347 type:complete len:216 (+) Transcript_30162:38-685(+)